MSRGAGPPREARGYEREQGAGAPRSGDATDRESLAATGMYVTNCDDSHIIWHVATRKHAGGDRRIGAGRRRVGVWYLFGIAEVAT